MSAVSRKLVEGRSGNLFIVEGSPGGGYTLLHVQTSVVGRYQRSWQAVRRAVDGIDSDPADGVEVTGLVENRAAAVRIDAHQSVVPVSSCAPGPLRAGWDASSRGLVPHTNGVAGTATSRAIGAVLPAVPVAEFAVSFSRRGQRSRGGMPVPPPASPLRDITSTTVAPVAVCVGV